MDPSQNQVRNDDLEKRFTYHPPKEGQPKRYEDIRYETIRHNAILFAYGLSNDCPPSRELSLALTKLEEVVFWANAAIARNE